MLTGSYKVAFQTVDHRGYYAVVRLEAERIPGRELFVTFDDRAVDQYRAAARFGVEYAWESVRIGLHVKVIEVDYAPVDTSSPIVVFAAAKAMWKALRYVPKRPIVLDTERRRIYLPC